METLEEKACTELWYQFEPQLRKLCMAKMQSCSQEIDDVIAEVFLALCKKTAQSGLPEHPKAWLYGTAAKIINAKYKEHYKSLRKVVSMSDREYSLPFADGFESEVLEHVRFEQLQTKLEEELTAEEKLLVRMIYDERLKLHTVAKRFGMQDSAVKQRVYRLRKKIQKIARKNNL